MYFTVNNLGCITNFFLTFDPSILIDGTINIILNAMFVSGYGYIAAAYTTLISFFILFIITWFVVNFRLKLNPTALWIIFKPTILLVVSFGFYLLMLNFVIIYVLRL